MEKPLVVIVDESSRDNLLSLGYRWFAEAEKSRKQGNYVIETPLGIKREINGVLLKSPRLDEHSAEYLYLELTNTCNFSCRHCGIKGDIIHIDDMTDENAKYMTPEFAEKLSFAIKHHPFEALRRNLFYGGGEPFIAPEKFRVINKIFSKLERTTEIVITNGCQLPLEQEELYNFMFNIGNPYTFFTLSPQHKAQYASLSKSGRANPEKIPVNVSPEKAIHEKIKIMQKYYGRKSSGFTVLSLMDKNGRYKILETELRNHIIKMALKKRREINIVNILENEQRQPCSQGQELAIRSNGDLYPYCTDIFNGHPKLGVIGLLLSKN